jgi:hypothetical protein
MGAGPPGGRLESGGIAGPSIHLSVKRPLTHLTVMDFGGRTARQLLENPIAYG